MKEFLKKDRFAAMAGVELIEAEKGYAKARMLLTSEHLNAVGVCQGGAIFTLADLAFAAVANNGVPPTFSVSTNITYIRSVREGYVYAEAREVVSHHRLPFIEIRITDENDEVIAVVTSTGYRKKM
ncbi:MAG: PaaI family thioesterase [Bacteroidaceae bacterium]|nr:PaaI family thioesterase [Bacteroidaceae bacterium]